MRGSMTSAEDTIRRIDTPVTPVSTKPDKKPDVGTAGPPLADQADQPPRGVLCVTGPWTVLLHRDHDRIAHDVDRGGKRGRDGGGDHPGVDQRCHCGCACRPGCASANGYGDDAYPGLEIWRKRSNRAGSRSSARRLRWKKHSRRSTWALGRLDDQLVQAQHAVELGHIRVGIWSGAPRLRTSSLREPSSSGIAAICFSQKWTRRRRRPLQLRAELEASVADVHLKQQLASRAADGLLLGPEGSTTASSF